MGIEFIGRKGELNDKSINDLKVKAARVASILDNHLITVEK
jgi:hypothetical protein